MADNPADARQAEATVAAHAAGWLAASRERFKSLVELALAEARLAATSVALMAFMGGVAAICAMSAWGLLVAGAVLALLAAGVPLWAQLLVLATAHVGVAVALVRRVFVLARNLEFPETRQQLAAKEEPQ